MKLNFFGGEIENRTKVARETCMISINNRCVGTFTNFFRHLCKRKGWGLGVRKKGATLVI